MRRIPEEQPKQSVWEKEVDVRVSVKELAMIYAIMGRSSTSSNREDFDRLFGVGMFDKLMLDGVSDDQACRTYKDAEEILRQEGAIE